MKAINLLFTTFLLSSTFSFAQESTLIQRSLISINLDKKVSKAEVYANHTSEKLFIKAHSGSNILLQASNGEIIYEKLNTQSIEGINLNELGSGVYYLSLIHDEEDASTTGKIILQ